MLASGTRDPRARDGKLPRSGRHLSFVIVSQYPVTDLGHRWLSNSSECVPASPALGLFYNHHSTQVMPSRDFYTHQQADTVLPKNLCKPSYRPVAWYAASLPALVGRLGPLAHRISERLLHRSLWLQTQLITFVEMLPWLGTSLPRLQSSKLLPHRLRP